PAASPAADTAKLTETTMAVSGEAPTARKSATATAQSRKNGHQGTTSDQNGSVDLALILASLQTMQKGDFSVRLPVAWTGIQGKIADTFNDIVAANEQMAAELTRVGQTVGKEGRTRERTRFEQHRGSWGQMEVSLNTLIEDLLRPTTE